LDEAVMETLSTEACWALLATEQVGRLGVIRGGYRSSRP
jgi:nitroimidazol reductase NimA-like FMN-containing flavoprotein (pyridoxamine 5'-phosphate oxidase superfamily)